MFVDMLGHANSVMPDIVGLLFLSKSGIEEEAGF